MVCNLKASNDSTITIGFFEGLGIIQIALITPWEYPLVPTVRVFRFGSINS